MTPYISTSHVSGGLSQSDVIPDRVHCKIGDAESGTAGQIYQINNLSQAKDIFTKGPLVDSLEQYFSEFNPALNQSPVPVLCARSTLDVAGVIGTPTKDGTGLATATTGGTVTGSRVVKLLITLSGAGGTAKYKKSVDGGVTFGSELTTPSTGLSISLDAGATISFTDDGTTPADTFHLGDIWTIVLSAPQSSFANKLVVLESLAQDYRIYWFHILGGSSIANAVSLNSVLDGWTVDKNIMHPTFAILEGLNYDEAVVVKGSAFANVGEYFLWLQNYYDTFFSDRVSIVCSEGRYVRGGVESAGGVDYLKTLAVPLGEFRNAASFVSACLAGGPVNESAAYVSNHKSLTMYEIRYWSEGFQDYMDSLHDKRLLVLKQYPDNNGIYVASDRIKSHPDSDFVEIPERRRVDKVHRILYKSGLPYLKGDSSLLSLPYLKTVLDAAISSEMEVAGQLEISGHKLTMDPNKTFAATKILDIAVELFVANRIDAIRFTTSFSVAK